MSYEEKSFIENNIIRRLLPSQGNAAGIQTIGSRV
jgi:hypothetical protein